MSERGTFFNARIHSHDRLIYWSLEGNYCFSLEKVMRKHHLAFARRNFSVVACVPTLGRVVVSHKSWWVKGASRRGA